MSKVPMKVLRVPGSPDLSLTLVIYGLVKALTPQEAMEQGFYIHKGGEPTSYKNLPKADQKAVKKLLLEKFSEHAKLIGIQNEKPTKQRATGRTRSLR